jgi:hypothetical protein
MTDNRSQSAEEYQGDSGRRSAIDAFGARERVTDTLSEAPLIALAGGLAAGALIAALLPRTDRETEILGPVGSRLGQAAAEAARAAREAGKQELGLLSDARSPMEAIVDKAVGAVSAAGDAAASSVKGKQKA